MKRHASIAIACLALAVSGRPAPAGDAPAPAAPPAGPASPALSFRAGEGGEFLFDTGVLRGKLRGGGKSMGITSAIHVPTGRNLCRSNGLFGHYRVFANGKRYGGGAWDWPSEARLRDDGSVEVRWPAAEGRPFEMWAVYRWESPSTLDLETGVRAGGTGLKGFESFLASYFDEKFASCRVDAKTHPRTGGGPGFVAAEASLGTWLMFPREPDLAKLIGDGRWKLPPNPVDWVVLPPFERPLAVRRDKEGALAAVLMARPGDCFAVAMPHEAEGHYSVYLSLFGRDLKSGESARARSRLVIEPSLTDAGAIERYEAFRKEAAAAGR